MVIASGYYVCHSFDLGRHLLPFSEWVRRDSLTTVPVALRYCELETRVGFMLVNQLGIVLVFQRIKDALEHKVAKGRYDDAFEMLFNEVRNEMHHVFGCEGTADTSFFLEVGPKARTITWSEVSIGPKATESVAFIKALFIDELCRVMERNSVLFTKQASVAADRKLVELAEALFPLASPPTYLSSSQEIAEITNYYDAWNLTSRAMGARQKFAESVANTQLFRGHLERNRQSVLNSVMLSIAFVSLAQVSTQVASVIALTGLTVSVGLLNQMFVALAVFVLVSGVSRFVLWPALVLQTDSIKRWRIARRVARYSKRA